MACYCAVSFPDLKLTIVEVCPQIKSSFTLLTHPKRDLLELARSLLLRHYLTASVVAFACSLWKESVLNRQNLCSVLYIRSKWWFISRTMV